MARRPPETLTLAPQSRPWNGYTASYGKILQNRQEAERPCEQMQHVEAVIKMLDPSYNVARIAIERRTADPWFKHGTLIGRRWTCSGRTGPMTGADIARAVLAANNVQTRIPMACRPWLRPYRRACGIALAGVSNRLASWCRRGGA
jgi:hypothetical protein